MKGSRASDVVLKIALGTGVVCLFAGMAVYIYLCYAAGLPLHADPATGHTVELNVHGSILYMTELQQWLSTRLAIGGLILMACARWRLRRNS